MKYSLLIILFISATLNLNAQVVQIIEDPETRAHNQIIKQINGVLQSETIKQSDAMQNH